MRPSRGRPRSRTSRKVETADAELQVNKLEKPLIELSTRISIAFQNDGSVLVLENIRLNHVFYYMPCGLVVAKCLELNWN